MTLTASTSMILWRNRRLSLSSSLSSEERARASASCSSRRALVSCSATHSCCCSCRGRRARAARKRDALRVRAWQEMIEAFIWCSWSSPDPYQSAVGGISRHRAGQLPGRIRQRQHAFCSKGRTKFNMLVANLFWTWCASYFPAFSSWNDFFF